MSDMARMKSDSAMAILTTKFRDALLYGLGDSHVTHSFRFSPSRKYNFFTPYSYIFSAMSNLEKNDGYQWV